MSESSSTFYSTSQCTSTLEELTSKDTHSVTQIGIDCLLASVGFQNPTELLRGPQTLKTSEPEDYQIALAISLYDRGFTAAQIVKATGVNINDSPPEPVTRAKTEKAEATHSSRPPGPPKYSFSSVLNSVILENLIFKELKVHSTDFPKKRLLQHAAKPGKPLGITSGLRKIAEYWQLIFQLILHLRNVEKTTGYSFKHSPSLVSAHLGISKARLSRLFDSSLDWPYFLQLLVTIYGPTDFYCPTEATVETTGQSIKKAKVNKFYFLAPDSTHSVTYFLLPPTRISSLLDKIADSRKRLNTIIRACPPKLRPAQEILEISKTLDIMRTPLQKKALDIYNNKQTVYNAGLVLNYVLEKLPKQSKLFATHPVLVPSDMHGAFTPIPSRLFATLAKKHGFLTPSWLTVPNLRCESTHALNEKLNTLITPPIVPAHAPSKLYTANRVKDLKDLVSISPTIHPDSSLLPENYHDLSHHPDVEADSRLHITYLSPPNSVPLTIDNIVSCLADFIRYETYLAQNSNE
jgi:hypothetical protein